MLGSNMEALKMQLLYAQAMLNNVRGREIHNPALGELLDKLRHLAYGAEDVLDELDYFRIQDELDGTYHAADAHDAGFVQDLALNARHTVRACVNKLKLPVCSRAARKVEQDDGGKQGYLSGFRFCGVHEISSSPPSPANQIHGRCMPKVASSTREAAVRTLSVNTSHAILFHPSTMMILTRACWNPPTRVEMGSDFFVALGFPPRHRRGIMPCKYQS